MRKLNIISLCNGLYDSLKIFFLYGPIHNVDFTLTHFKSFKRVNFDSLYTEIMSIDFFPKKYLITDLKKVNHFDNNLYSSIKKSNYSVVFICDEQPTYLSIEESRDNLNEVGYLNCFFDKRTLTALIDLMLTNSSKSISEAKMIHMNASEKDLIIEKSNSNPLIIFKELEKVIVYNFIDPNNTKNIEDIVSDNIKHSIEKIFFECLNSKYDSYFKYLETNPDPIYVMRCFLIFLKQMISLSRSNDPDKILKMFKLFRLHQPEAKNLLTKLSYSKFINIIELINCLEIAQKKASNRQILVKFAMELEISIINNRNNREG